MFVFVVLMLMLSFLFNGGMVMVLDFMVGEKECGILESLFIFLVCWGEVVVGKLLVIMLMVFVIGFFSLLGFFGIGLVMVVFFKCVVVDFEVF